MQNYLKINGKPCTLSFVSTDQEQRRTHPLNKKEKYENENIQATDCCEKIYLVTLIVDMKLQTA